MAATGSMMSGIRLGVVDMDIVLEEESLRDGLQGEARLFSLEEKLEVVRLLVAAGVRRIQLGSFVHPQTVPQMANTDALAVQVRRQYPDLLCTALVLNEKGLDRALKAGLGHVSMSVSLADSHSRKNSGMPAADALMRMQALITQAVAAGLQVRAGLQCAFGFADAGDIGENMILAAAELLIAAGAAEINLADTAGLAHPRQIRQLVIAVRARFPETVVSLHLHDTRGLGLVNLYAGIEAGVRLFDVAAGGLGGCPFIEGAAGNVAAEDGVHLIHSLGRHTGIDLEQLCQVVDYYELLLERKLPGRMKRVLSGRHSGGNFGC